MILDRELSYGDACRGPLYLATSREDFRALSRSFLGLPPLSADRTRTPLRTGTDCLLFPETQQSTCGIIREYWTQYGGLMRFGYPLSPLRYEADPNSPTGMRLAQWFERARFEIHLNGAGQPTVLLGLLGKEAAKSLQDEWPFVGVDDPGDGSWFPETGHTLRGNFRAHWERTGGWRVYGLPISEEFYEVNPDDGRVYVVQYFERNRFEHHPELAGTAFEILLGQLGRKLYQGDTLPSATLGNRAYPLS
jgi:hypothetical protein